MEEIRVSLHRFSYRRRLRLKLAEFYADGRTQMTKPLFVGDRPAESRGFSAESESAFIALAVVGVGSNLCWTQGTSAQHTEKQAMPGTVKK